MLPPPTAPDQALTSAMVGFRAVATKWTETQELPFLRWDWTICSGDDGPPLSALPSETVPL